MNRTDHLLFIAAEECMEVGQRISKAARFGLEECEPDQPHNNATRILIEIADLLAMLEMLSDADFAFRDANRINGKQLQEWGDAKKKKVEKYLKYSESRKRLETA